MRLKDAPSHTGLMVLGSDRGCGKTTVAAGLAGALLAEGFGIQALKPLELLDAIEPHQRGHDQAFLNHTTQQYALPDMVTVPSAQDVSMPVWNRLITQCRQLPYPCLLDTPGQVATPWQWLGGTVRDALDCAVELGVAVLLVSAIDPMFFEKTRAALTILAHRSVLPVGFVGVSRTPDGPSAALLASVAQQISQAYGVPFLGAIPYNPHISVHGGQHSNLVRLVQDHVDLLPLQMGMCLTL